MSHLIAISVGPVQEFIAAARRTRDLWFGSYLLSEISREVAKSVEADGGKLIFPASAGPETENVANVILAELPSGEPRDVAAKARQAAQKRWLEFANEAHREASDVIRQAIWDDQVKDVIEFYAAWVPHTDSAKYPDDRKKLMRLLAGRKNLRDFKAAQGLDVGLHKSSLDGQRATVFVQAHYHGQRDELRQSWPPTLRLSPGEELDVVGVTKRLGKLKGEQLQSYPSVARVAAETWLSGKEKEGSLDALIQACDKLISKGLNTVREDRYQYFRYEGTVIFKDRLTDLQKELKLQDADLAELKAALDDLRGEPNPYLAVLVADGDRMGAAISALHSASEHRMFSQALAGFATEVRKIVNDHSGVLVYAGGDDVLAFLPVDKCLKCARELRDKFIECLKQHVPENTPTLSVGIAIGHFMENLEDLLDYGRAAEKAAKNVESKDALAVHLHKRGGAPIKIASRWDTRPEEQLDKFAKLMNEGIIPTKLPYELREMAKLYEKWPEALAKDAINQDLPRLIAKKASSSETTVRAELADELNRVDSAATLLRFAEELLVARQIATAQKQAEGN